MRRDRKPDLETLSLFVILGILTVILVMGLRLVLFAPGGPLPGSVPPPEIRASGITTTSANQTQLNK